MTIDRYVELVQEELPFARRMRRRIGAEIADYLHESMEHKRDRGLCVEDAQREACESFGSPDEVARTFAESRGVKAMATPFTRSAGLAGLLGGLLVTVSITVQFLIDFTIVWADGVGFLGAVLMFIGLIGMHFRQRGTYGSLGKLGFRLMLAGIPISAVSVAMWFAPGAAVGMIVTAVGVILVGIATWRAAVLPRAPLFLMLLGGLIVFAGAWVGNEGTVVREPGDFVAVAAIGSVTVAWAWMGYHLWSEKAHEAVLGSPPEAVA